MFFYKLILFTFLVSNSVFRQTEDGKAMEMKGVGLESEQRSSEEIMVGNLEEPKLIF